MKTYSHGGRQTTSKIRLWRMAFCIVVFGFFIGHISLKAAVYEDCPCFNDSPTAIEVTYEPASVDKHTEAYIRQRILEVYEFEGNRELFYTSKAYYDLWWRMVRKDDRVGGLELFDYEHWYQTQDEIIPGVKVVYVEIITWAKAVAVVNVNGGEIIKFPLVFEEGDWFIDDFLTGFNGHWHSEKKSMIKYVYEEE